MYRQIMLKAGTLWTLSTLVPFPAPASETVMRDRPIFIRTETNYGIPDVMLISAAGKPVSLRGELAIDKPVLLNFIFTSCVAFCPLLTATLAKVQTLLQEQGETFKMISISIDPEHDTAARLHAYAQRYRAAPEWLFLTGDNASIMLVQQAFDVYRGNKMNHVSLTLMRHPDGHWKRFEGLVDAATLVEALSKAGGSQP